MIVLALDLGRETGWAAGVVGAAPSFGRVRLPGPEASGGARFGALSNAISDLIVTWRPALVVKEAPLRLGAQTSAYTARQQYGYHATVEEACWRQDVPLFEEEADAIRKAMLGRSRWPKGTLVKAQIVEWCRSRGYEVRQADEADAVVTWLWACAQQPAVQPA